MLGSVKEVLVTGEGDVLNTVLQILRASVPAALGTDAYEQYQLPYVPEVILSVTAARKLIKARPPSGLIELGRRDMRIRQVRQALQDFWAAHTDHQGRMPTKARLLQAGYKDLVHAIEADGFLEVAQLLNMTGSRKPNGFWDNLEVLDEELSWFVASMWMELPHPEQPRRSYWHNPVLRTTQWREPDAPERVSLDGGGTQLFLEDERSTVMPSRSAVQRAGRWDLHHAIMRHGGYRRVAAELERPPAWGRQPVEAEALRTSLRSLSRQLHGKAAAGQSGPMPTAAEVVEHESMHLWQSIMRAGGFHAVAGKVGLAARRSKRGLWKDADVAAAALLSFMTDSQKVPAGYLPTREQLRVAGRHDLLHALQVHGGLKLAGLLHCQLPRRGRKGGFAG